MDKLIARANIDHYLSVVKSTDLSSQNRASIIKLWSRKKICLPTIWSSCNSPKTEPLIADITSTIHQAARRLCRWFAGSHAGRKAAGEFRSDPRIDGAFLRPDAGEGKLSRYIVAVLSGPFAEIKIGRGLY